MTHDQSFPGVSGKSVNSRVITSDLPPIMYSFVLSQTIHYIIGVRARHPNTKIFLCKFDIDAAYRRCTLLDLTAFERLTIFCSFLLVALRLTFGGAPGPSIWGVISETIADIGNTLLLNNNWDHHSLYDKISNKLGSPSSLPTDIPFAQARSVSVPIPANDKGKADIFIDDSIGVAPDIDDIPRRVIRAIPLAIRTLARPVSSDDFIPRQDTRSLTISLPKHKAQDWMKEIELIIESGRSNYKDLESMMGRLNHVACIFHPMHHFMGRLYKALYRAKARKGWTALSPNELQDLGLHSEFIQLAASGVSLNNITCRQPTHIYRSDACEYGLGGYNPLSGKAWRWELPMDLRLRTSINSLEFIACVITIWVDILSSDISPEDSIWSQPDSSSAAGWLRKSNFAEDFDEFIQLSTARKLASLLIGSESCLDSQWFSGDRNSISDSLSRDFHMESTHLSTLLVSHFPKQASFGLEIHPLPSSIVSWATFLLQSRLQEMQWSREPTRSKLALGLASNDSYGQSGSKMTSTWTTSTDTRNIKFSVPLLKQ
jgi:hypothetical protein